MDQRMTQNGPDRKQRAKKGGEIKEKGREPWGGTKTRHLRIQMPQTDSGKPRACRGETREGIEFPPASPYVTRAERICPIFLRPDIMATSIDEVSSNVKPLVRQMRESPNRVKKLVEMLPQQEGTPLAVALI
ncbi:hypothetical protein U1Q18_008325 [Sarracenia purpurea var. burkii]